MGACHSNQDSDGSVTSGGRNSDSEDVHLRVETAASEHEKNISIIKHDLKNNLEIFLVNNMLMSVQFFENYQLEIQKLLSSTRSTKKEEFNRTLLQNETVECSSPDVIFDKVNKNVSFRPLHGPQKDTFDLLSPKRLIVINDKIEVVNSVDIPQYSSIDKPPYQVKLEESPKKGYVRLRHIDANKSPKTEKTNHNNNTVTYESIPGTSKSSDSDIYEYTTITNLRTPQQLKINEEPARRDTLPETCFTTRKVKKAHVDIPLEDDENVEYSEEDLMETVTYIDATGFMNYFENEQFPNSLGKALGFSEKVIKDAKSIPGKIFCSLKNAEDNPIPCEVIPSVVIPWPAEQAYEFRMREDRPTIIDENTGIRYRWPTEEMIREITSLNCVAIPKGYQLKRGEYSDASIEWEIAFPKAEMFLETRMTHTQMRCFLFLLVLHKTYIDPITGQNGLLVEHIRCHMYWECEANYRTWPEHRLGSKLLKIIRKLHDRLATATMPDYFIRSKNHFRHIPNMYLVVAQKVFHDLLQAPTMYFLKALRNIHYTSDQFYSTLDFKDLYKTLVPNDVTNISVPNLILVDTKQKYYPDVETRLRHIRELENRKKFAEQKMKIELENAKRKQSVDSIDLTRRCGHDSDVNKIKNILIQFSEHFIDIARDSSRFNSNQQALFYLKQADCLARIMESRAFVKEAHELLQIIIAAEEDCKKKMDFDAPPLTPVRNSIQIDFPVAQQLRNNIVLQNSPENKVKSSQSFKAPQVAAIGKLKADDARSPRKTVAFVH